MTLSPTHMDSVYTRTRSRRGAAAGASAPSRAQSHRRVKSHTEVSRLSSVGHIQDTSPTRRRKPLSGDLYKDVGPDLGSSANDPVASRTRSSSQYAPTTGPIQSTDSRSRCLASAGASSDASFANFTGANKASRSLSAPTRNEPPLSSSPFDFDSSPFGPTTFDLNDSSSPTTSPSPPLNEFMRTSPPSALGMHRQPPAPELTFSHSSDVFSPSFTTRESSLSDATHTSVGSSSTEVESSDSLPSPSNRSASTSRERNNSAEASLAQPSSRTRSVSNSSTNTVIVPQPATSSDTTANGHLSRGDRTSSSTAAAGPAPMHEPRPQSHSGGGGGGGTSIVSTLDETTDCELTPTSTAAGSPRTHAMDPLDGGAQGVANSADVAAQGGANGTNVPQNTPGGSSLRDDGEQPVVMSSAEEILETTPIPSSFETDFP